MKPIAFALWLFALTGCLSNTAADQTESGTSKLEPQSSSGGGNGDYYGGKPDSGTYSRIAGESPCVNGPATTEKIHIGRNKAILTKRDPTTCLVTNEDIHLDDLEYASYEPGRVGHSEGIYVKSGVWQAQGINEAWCRLEGSNTQTGYDVIVLADYTAKRFVTKVTDSRRIRTGQTARREYFVDRIEREVHIGAKIRYRKDDFELEIDLQEFNGVTGKFRSSIRFEASGIDLRTEIGCRISGELEGVN